MNEIATILLATADRPQLLRETLTAIAAQERDKFELRIVIADNGLTNCARDIVQDISLTIHTQIVSTGIPGRSKVVNKALASLVGDFVFFTDDDVTPSRRWLADQIELYRQGKDRIAVCGPITPRFPTTPCAAWLSGTPLESIVYARFAPLERSGTLPESILPLGPNFSARRDALTTMRFREDLGPSMENGPLSCDDIDFVSRLRERHMPLFRGGGFYYAASAEVSHRVRPDQMTFESVIDRFLTYGRSMTQMRGRISHFVSPTRLSRMGPSSDITVRNHQSAELSFYLGQIQQLQHLGLLLDSTFVCNWLLKNRECVEQLPLGVLGEKTRATLLAAGR